MKIFLDTNVLVSAFTTRGLCADVVREIIDSENLIVSQQVLDELKEVLTNKFGIPFQIAAEAVALLCIDSIIAEPKVKINQVIKDNDDIALLSAALTEKVDVFITGDKLLLSLKKIDSMEILSPRGFWEKIRNK